MIKLYKIFLFVKIMSMIFYYNKIKNFKKVCDIFECTHRSLKRWVIKYDKIKNLDRKEREKVLIKLNKYILIL